MYNAALSAEAKYLATFNATYDTNFNNLRDALDQFTTTVSKERDKKKQSYEPGVTKKTAEKLATFIIMVYLRAPITKELITNK